jgi:hypothetical protein
MAAYRARRAPVEEEPQALAPELAEAPARATRKERLVALVAHAATTNWGQRFGCWSGTTRSVGSRASASAMRSRDALGDPLDYE